MVARRKISPQEQTHMDWLGMVQPEGLVVSIPVLLEANAYQKNGPELQARLRELCPQDALSREALPRFLAEVLGWPAARLTWDASALDPAFALDLLDLGLHLVPDAVLSGAQGQPLVLLRWSEELDAQEPHARFPLSRQGAFERLLLDLQRPNHPATPVGLHASPAALRLTYAPRGEAPGSLTFPLDGLTAYDGRLLLDALWMLLGKDRLYNVPAEQRLLPLLQASRKRQEKVTVALADQVQQALEALVQGFHVADQRTRGELLRDWRDDLKALHDGLVSVILRLVFLLYCEDNRDPLGHGILPVENDLYLQSYSLSELADRLAQERTLYQETMTHRFGAWSRLCALFRLVYAGCDHPSLKLPARQGELFDPDRAPFLEGRRKNTHWKTTPSKLPPLDDGVVAVVLDHLLTLEGQRVSYRNLDVEQIGSVYEALLDLTLARAASDAYRLKTGAVLERADLDAAEQPLSLLAAAARLKPAELLRRAPSLAALGAPRPAPPTPQANLFDPTPTTPAAPPSHDWRALLAPFLAADPTIPPQTLYLRPSLERRHSGSHYTPPTLTAPIVRRTLDPLLGPSPSAAHLLSLKLCDPAMGSGAFLVEACRYLADALLLAWTREGSLPPASSHTSPLLLARRLVAERCLYGVDKNPFAVHLARMSLWLVTLARDLPFTFVDHALTEGDAIVGVQPQHIEDFSLSSAGQLSLAARRAMQSAERTRRAIHDLDFQSWAQKHRLLDDARAHVAAERTLGDTLLAIEWANTKTPHNPVTATQAKQRAASLRPLMVQWYLGAADAPLPGEVPKLLQNLPLKPFHWQLEFPEVFLRERPGFDAILGNPPFGGKNTILDSNGEPYIKLLQTLNPHAHGNSDLVAYFFLRAASILREGGTFGLVATNTIKQGDTRATGLQHMTAHGITLYDAVLDQPWAGGAAVVVDVVHGCRGPSPTGQTLNSSLENTVEIPDPKPLKENEGKGFIGCYVLGTGFLLTTDQAKAFVLQDPVNEEIIKPYLGGEELNSNIPEDEDGHIQVSRHVINFGDMTEEEAQKWPELFDIIKLKVKPERDLNNREVRKKFWWKFGERAPKLYNKIKNIEKCMVCSSVSKYMLFEFQPTDRVFSHALVVFALDDWFSFAVLQSRVHEVWAREAGLGSSLETRARYTPSTCFETFPFPRGEAGLVVAAGEAGRVFYEARQAAMIRYQEGMTKLWNRVVDPENDASDIEALRRLKEAMDRAVLAAYGWSDLGPSEGAEIVRRLRLLNVERAR